VISVNPVSFVHPENSEFESGIIVNVTVLAGSSIKYGG
jgi:hypothetical protein